ncbi:serine-rich adhesin for platelets isoform X6 [Dendroctonus ponderosae]|nr:serine-rich adhesin for platelets isoform X6 [Dendroctonus ponderosae]
MTMSERVAWNGERVEAKRPRLDIKVENEEVNDNYCFPDSVLQSKENNVALIRTTPGGSVPALVISNNTSHSSSRTVQRCTPAVSRQTPSSPISLTTQLTYTSRFSDVVLTIIKQPEQQHRARYQTEGSRGAVKDIEGNGFPIVQLTGYYKPAVLQVYIGTDIGKVSPHMFYQACKVSGKNSTPCVEKKIEGTCVIELALDPAKDMCANCDCVGILKERNVDVEHRFPDQLGNRSKKKSTRCRMIFRTTITHDNGQSETLQVCSQPIVCTQPPGIPEICKKSLTSCPASGGLELFVLGKNFLKDTKVIFQQFEEGRVCWEQSVVPDKEYLQQTHFVCVVPPYRRHNITEPIPVRLCVVSSGKTSELHQFVYTPVNGTVSAHTDVHAQHAQTFTGALWSSSSFRKHQQDLDMMPPPDSNLVPLSSRRPSMSLPSTSDAHSPPLNVMKQEYIDENSQGSLSDSMEICHERYRPLSESSLDVNHDSNMSMINDNSVDIMQHDSMMSHMSENSNLSVAEEDIELARRNSIPLCDNAVMKEDDSCNVLHGISTEVRLPRGEISRQVMTAMEKVMDLRMKLPMNANVTDYVTTASSMVATLKRFGIEDTSAPLPPQSAQSVESYLTKIESKDCAGACPSKANNGKSMAMQSISNLLTSTPANMTPPVFLTSQQPFLTENEAINTIAKSEAAAIAEQVITGTTTSHAITTLTTSLDGSISTTMNTTKLDEILNSTLVSHIGSPTKANGIAIRSPVDAIVADQDVLLASTSPLLVPPVNNTQLSSPLLGSQNPHSPSGLSPEVILNSQLSPSIMCRNSSSVQPEGLLSSSPLSAICRGGTTSNETSPMPATLTAAQSTLLPNGTAPESATLLSSEPEKAVLLEAAVDFLKTQKNICELTTTAQDIMEIAATSTDTSSLAMGGGFMPYTNVASENSQRSMHISKNVISHPKPDYLSMGVAKDISSTAGQNNKKNGDGLIHRSFTSLTENELINFINPTCFDQGNSYHH